VTRCVEMPHLGHAPLVLAEAFLVGKDAAVAVEAEEFGEFVIVVRWVVPIGHDIIYYPLTLSSNDGFDFCEG